LSSQQHLGAAFFTAAPLASNLSKWKSEWQDY
jgi:hypothetical protein